MDTPERRARAEARRARMILHKTQLRADELDLSPVRGADAIALVQRLTHESWALSGRPLPTYSRAEIPCQFVPRQRR